ncbi:MAG TPA: efflux transporter outer membrane subunit [Steroidobacteraceae bacterium]|nr:efflux transporter outer membrane subunit [Steroidobacteraceae bacterium]
MRAASRLALVLACGLGGCSLAPHYERPATPPPGASYTELGDWKVAVPADNAPRGAWWTMFEDEELNDLESRVTDANQSLKAALARLEEARAQTRIARAGYFPTLTANASATRQRVSVNGPGFAPGDEPIYNTFILGADLSYEIDLFGRVRNTVSGARASEQATAGDVATLDLSVHAELATDYFTLRGLDAQQQLLDRTVADYARALELTRNRYQGGAAARSDVQLAEAQLENARTQAEDTRLKRAQTEHAIAVLVGVPASAFHLEAQPLEANRAVPVVDPGLPSQLLERRPDVAAAERRVAAANAGIGVARAAYFPVFSLFGAAGQESTQSTNWLSAPSRFWSIGPQGVLTVFDAGLHAAQSAAAHATYDEQVANYRGTVLGAYQEVEDNLAALHQLALEDVSQAAAVTATQGALEQAVYRYKGGVVTYLEVVATENAALAARLAAVDIETRRIGATVLLVRALGGDWRSGRPVDRPVAQR